MRKMLEVVARFYTMEVLEKCEHVRKMLEIKRKF